jgi:hypothetical protein
LIVWPVLKEVTENDLFQGNIGLRARYDMTNKELLDACLEAWKVHNDKNYRLFLIRGDGKTEISLEENVKEAGLRNGDYLEIVSA